MSKGSQIKPKCRHLCHLFFKCCNWSPSKTTVEHGDFGIPEVPVITWVVIAASLLPSQVYPETTINRVNWYQKYARSRCCWESILLNISPKRCDSSCFTILMSCVLINHIKTWRVKSTAAWLSCTASLTASDNCASVYLREAGNLRNLLSNLVCTLVLPNCFVISTGNRWSLIYAHISTSKIHFKFNLQANVDSQKVFYVLTPMYTSSNKTTYCSLTDSHHLPFCRSF